MKLPPSRFAPAPKGALSGCGRPGAADMQIIANGLQIEADIQGPEQGQPILLIMGLGMQLIGWPEELVQMLVQRGFRVIRHDNRDVGLRG